MRRALKVYFDGSCHGVDGRIAIAVVARGQVTIRRDVGTGTSGDAEWLALIAALEIARATGADDIVLLGDSADVVAKANGALPVRSPEAAHLARVDALCFNRRPRIRWIKRTQNLAGIALARL